MAKLKEFLCLLVGLLSITYIPESQASFPYFGTKIGALKRLHHGVAGDVYAVDSRTIFVKNFNYDGEAPAAYFYVGNTKKPSNEGASRLRDERGGNSALTRRYRNKDITLSLPEGKTLRDVKWFSVWCDEFAVNFGDVSIPPNLDFPRPQKIAALQGVHGVRSDNIVIVDAQTLLIPNFSYDGEAPDAKFWVGRGSKPSPQGLRIPDENGKEIALRRYDRKTIVLTLPGDLTIFDVGHFGVWCEAFTVDFGHVRIPDGLNVPPSLKMLGISPQRSDLLLQSKLNCEVLYDDLAFEVRWAVAGESIVVQLVAKLADGEYMSFGISPKKDEPVMIGADVVVAWVDKETGKGYAQDYFLDDKSQCSGKRGSCPDVNIEDDTNSIRLLNAAMVNGYSIVTYQRSLGAADSYDLPILMNTSQAIVWAIGPLNQRNEVSFHTQYTKSVHQVNFSRQPTWNCPMPEGDKPEPDDEDEPEEEAEEFYDNRTQKPTPQALQRPTKRQEVVSSPQRKPVPTPMPANTKGAWDIPAIQCYEPEDGVFYAQMGPTGGKHGYPAITGHVGWGISWYINGLLIPEIHLVRGKTYTFVVEGGHNPDIPAKYHPFYITDDPVGGYEYKTDEEKAGVRIFAGVHRSRSGKVTPTGVGRLCNWTPDIDGPPADDFQSFGAYQRTLTLECDEGEPGVITWTPDRNTPDTVYYHCFTHRHLGWKIHVHDRCDEGAAASEIDEVIAQPEEDYAAESSIRHETKVSPNDNFLLKHQTDLIKNHNMNGTPPKLSFEITKSSEITKLISDGIRAAEALEESLKNRRVPLPSSPSMASSSSSSSSSSSPSLSSSSLKLLPPRFPQLSTSAPEILSGETVRNLSTTTSLQAQQVPQDTQLPQNSGPPTYLRPPQTSMPYRPIKRRPYHPMKKDRLPNKRPYPPSLLASMMPGPRPVAIPQPSVIINHYRKPVSAHIKPYHKDKPYPMKPIASVLLLGQPTELDYMRQTEPVLKGTKPKLSGVIPVPYADVAPQETVQNLVFAFNGLPPKNEKDSLLPGKVSNVPTMTYKVPYDMKAANDEVDIASMKPAVNQGFKPDTVVVESGFKPILRRKTEEATDGENEEKISRRRDDPGSEIDEVMETDTLFLSQDTSHNQNFEPMFIPSPPDSTNDSLIYKLGTAAKLTAEPSDMEVEDGDDKIALAAERVDTYYLPPDNKPTTSQRPLPTGAVVTYDGKAVLDTSLVSPPKLEVRDNLRSKHGLSNTEALIRNTPQFGPFRGEMPPSIPDFLSAEKGNSFSKPITEYSNPLTLAGSTTPRVSSSSPAISTKLSLVKSSVA